MGKVRAKKNVRAKAKIAVAAAKQNAQQLMHKTLAAKKTPTKKEKSVQKHKKLLNRFAQMKKDQKDLKAQQQREKTKITGDLKPLQDALPSLQELYDLVKKKKKTETLVDSEKLVPPERLSAKQKIKHKRAEFVNRVKSLEKMIKDKEFQKNPRKVISNLVRNKYEQMDDGDDDDE